MAPKVAGCSEIISLVLSLSVGSVVAGDLSNVELVDFSAPRVRAIIKDTGVVVQDGTRGLEMKKENGGGKGVEEMRLKFESKAGARTM